MPQDNSKYEEYEKLKKCEEDLYDDLFEDFGISAGTLTAIWGMCVFARPCTQKEICEVGYASKQTINSAVKKLVEEGYIELTPSPENFREKLLTFTEKGKFLAKRTAEKMISAERKAFYRLSKEEQSEILRINAKHKEFLKEEFEKIKGENK